MSTRNPLSHHAPWVFLLIASCAVGTVFTYRLVHMGYFDKGGSIPVYGDAPRFTLTDRSGAIVRTEDLKGRVWVADYIFTRCPGP